MATFTDTLGFDKGSAAPLARGLDRLTRYSVTLNFPKIVAARAAAGLAALASADVLEVIPVPAKALVMAVGMDVTTINTAAATIALGDGASTAGYLAASAIGTIGSFAGVSALVEGTPNTFLPAFGLGKYYSAADTIDALFGTAAPAQAVVTVWALILDCSA
jgi:hypothetical protein